MKRLEPGLIEAQALGMCRSRHVHGAVLAVLHAPSASRHVAAAGNLEPARRFFAASVTKLIVTAVVIRLVERGEIGLDDPMSAYLPADLIGGLHVFKGVERTGEITLRHLISSHTGLKDYFGLKGADGRTHMSALLAGEDSAWPLERTLDTVRGLPALYPPGAPGKANYSDTNYQLMGRILETVSGKPLPALFADEVFTPLGLADTCIYTDPADTRPAPIHAGQKTIHLPRYMASISAEGGMVTTGDDLLTIGQAFFTGGLFDIGALMAQQNWRMLFWPGQFHFGLGLEKMWTPWFFSPFAPIRDVVGFWGQTGAFLFHHPETGLYFAGTANQATGRGHASAVRAMLRIIAAMRR